MRPCLRKKPNHKKVWSTLKLVSEILLEYNKDYYAEMFTGFHIFWHTLNLACCRLPVTWLRHNSPGPQSQRWKISGACAVSLCALLEQTCPSNRTGLQIFVQKWRAQQSPGPQSKVLRQLSPSCPVTRLIEAFVVNGEHCMLGVETRAWGLKATSGNKQPAGPIELLLV